jgi:cytochrome P450
VPIIARDSVEADTLEDFQIPAKALLVIVPYVTHRNPEFWDNPLAFDPAHFSEEQVAARPRYAFYPFGAGQRICIGNHFAMLEAVLLLAEIAQRYQLRLAARNNGDVKFVGVVRPASPLEMTASAR